MKGLEMMYEENLKYAYKKAEEEYRSSLNTLESLEEERKRFNKEKLLDLIDEHFESELKVVTYTDTEDEFEVRIFSKVYVESGGKKRLDVKRISNFHTLLIENFIYRYNQDHLWIDFDLGYNGDKSFEYMINLI